MVPGGSALHEGSRVGPRRGRRGPRRDHRATRPTSSATSCSWSCRTSGATLEQLATFGVVESVKAVSDLFAPVSGEVVATNDALAGEPELVNGDPYGGGWMLRVRLADAAQVDDLLDAAAYEQLIAEG